SSSSSISTRFSSGSSRGGRGRGGSAERWPDWEWGRLFGTDFCVPEPADFFLWASEGGVVGTFTVLPPGLAAAGAWGIRKMASQVEHLPFLPAMSESTISVFPQRALGHLILICTTPLQILPEMGAPTSRKGELVPATD